MTAPGYDGPAVGAIAAVGRVCVRHRFLVIGAWLLLVVALVGGARTIGTPTDNDLSLPGTDSQIVRNLAVTPTPSLASGTVIVVARAGRLDDAGHSRILARTAASLRRAEHVTTISAPSAGAGSLSADGRTGWFTVGLDVSRAQLSRSSARAIVEAASSPAGGGLHVLPGGTLAQVIDGSGAHDNEYIGLALAGVVLTLALGGLLGATLPLLTSALSLIATLETIGLAGNLTTIPTVATTVATMVGLGVGVDYSLFLLSRFREVAALGVAVPEAIARAVGDSGTSVAFAGVTVAVALAGLGLTGVPILQTLAWTSGTAVVFAVLSALTLLPALTSLVGRRVARGGILNRRLRRRRQARCTDAGETGGFWARQADRVTRRPWLVGGLALVLLAILAAPATDLRLGQLDAASAPPSTAVRHANDVITAAFGPGEGSALTVLGQLQTPVTTDRDVRVAELVQAVRAEPGVAAVGPTTFLADGRIVTVLAIPSTAGGDPSTAGLVHRLRHLSIAGMSVHVGGTTAARVDLAERVTARLPLVIAVVLLLSVAVLLLAFRAPLVALKAAAMDLISIGAAYGALTAVFTWGWGVRLVGLSGPVPIQSYVPLMLFALLFGLSMDYEVFLLTVVQRCWKESGDNRRSVREGLTATGGVITAAATIMVGVFLAFVPNDDPTVKMLGVGMAVAIAVDATVVRGLLAPATMALLGDLTWWSPRRWRARPGLHRAA